MTLRSRSFAFGDIHARLCPIGVRGKEKSGFAVISLTRLIKMPLVHFALPSTQGTEYRLSIKYRVGGLRQGHTYNKKKVRHIYNEKIIYLRQTRTVVSKLRIMKIRYIVLQVKAYFFQ